jgi:hypothetical protein
MKPAVWAIYPLAYLAYSLIRGVQTGKYLYPFLDPGLVGWQQTMLRNLAIAVAFLICGKFAPWRVVVAYNPVLREPHWTHANVDGSSASALSNQNDLSAFYSLQAVVQRESTSMLRMAS